MGKREADINQMIAGRGKEREIKRKKESKIERKKERERERKKER
jgi:hypothetical protein